MIELIKKLLREAITNLPDTTDKQQMKYLGHSSLSNPSRDKDLRTIRFKMARAAETATHYQEQFPNDNYFSLPTEGDGFYQVEFRHDGQVRTKQIRASADMAQQGGRFQPTDVGTCKDYQNIARYCFVKAGKDGKAIGLSPAEDATNKALIIFKNEILTFLGDSSYDDGQAADISKEKMTDKQAQHKEKKDLETELGFRITDAQWKHYLETGSKPKPKSGIEMDPDQAAELERQQQAAIERRNKAMARMGK